MEASPPGSKVEFAPEARDYYSISQAAAVLGVSRVSIWRWITDGRLPAFRLGHRTTRIKREDLERVLVQTKRPASGTPASGSLGVIGGDESGVAGPEVGATDHFVQFYETDMYLEKSVAEFIGTVLRTGDAGVVVATPTHREGIEQQLGLAGIDVDAARSRGRYVALDAAETLSGMMAGDAVDAQHFFEIIGEIVRHAAEHGRRVRVFGEMVALLAMAGNCAGAVTLEGLWNELQEKQTFSLLCAYPMDCPGGESLSAAFSEVCGAHSRVIPAESYTALPTSRDRQQGIAVLQQKARWLEAEIAARKRAEARLKAALDSERAAREATESALCRRDEFLSIAAHELKTPLTSLSGHAQLVLRRIE